jgi:hypothetical protein
MDALRELTDRELVRVAKVSFCPHWLCEANNEGFWAILLSNILGVIGVCMIEPVPFFCLNVRGRLQESSTSLAS